MKYTTAILSAAAGTAMAAPADNKGTQFTAITSHSGSNIHLSPVAATSGNLLLNQDDQDARCDTPGQAGATFSLVGDNLYLYSTPDLPQQQVYVDRSGMGQGKVGFGNKDDSLPRNGEYAGWKIEDGHLTFDGKEAFVACPGGEDGSPQTIWFDANGDGAPAGQKDCQGFSFVTREQKDPVSCAYRNP
ncbi:hypothetical protein K4F52_000439 [Lecanicillium sp. MT-2017a]|nr:hypothetical protein K4F52_000439 [Lecanicillium sp. MT-2017a]